MSLSTMEFDTIVAESSPTGNAAISVVRVSGMDAIEIAEGLIEERSDSPIGRVPDEEHRAQPGVWPSEENFEAERAWIPSESSGERGREFSDRRHAGPEGAIPSGHTPGGARSVFNAINSPPGRQVARCLVNLVHRGIFLDEVILHFYYAPRSYTGENLVEINCHGNPLIVESIINALEDQGARRAEAGEFTRRAFLNGKMSLDQAEAIMGIVGAANMDSVSDALRSHRGQLGREIDQVYERTISILAELEAVIDFPEDVTDAGRKNVERRINEIVMSLNSLIERTSSFGDRPMPRVVLWGERNVGKSTLFNALLGWDRSLVDKNPGTTRDYIEEPCRLDGIQVRLCDTAGLTEQAEGVEAMGIERSFELVEEADLILHVLDATRTLHHQGVSDELESMERKRVIVINKVDLKEPTNSFFDLRPCLISAVVGTGIGDLKKRIVDELTGVAAMGVEKLWISARQLSLLKQADSHLKRCLKLLDSSGGEVEICESLRLSAGALRGASGELVTDDVVDRIFKEFCVGK